MCPGQQTASLILLQASTPHAFGTQTPFVLSHRPSNLYEQLIVGILAHGTIDKLDLAACLFQFLDQEHLMDIVASQAIWGCDDHPIKGGTSDLIPQSVQSWATQTRSTVAIISKNVFVLPLPAMCLALSPQEVSLLLNSLRLRLPLRRHRHIDCYGSLAVLLSNVPLRNLSQARYAPAYQVLVRLIPPPLCVGSCSRVTLDAPLTFLHVYPPDGNTPFRLHQ